jgi:hypothetical protein
MKVSSLYWFEDNSCIAIGAILSWTQAQGNVEEGAESNWNHLEGECPGGNGGGIFLILPMPIEISPACLIHFSDFGDYCQVLCCHPPKCWTN